MAQQAEGTEVEKSPKSETAGASQGDAAAEVRPPVALFGSAAEAAGVLAVPEALKELERSGLSSKEIAGDVHWRRFFDPELV